MCRNIRPLFNFEPPATKNEIRSASLQFVRKISGSNKPSKLNEEVFYKAVSDIQSIINNLFSVMLTKAKPKNREIEASKAKKRFEKRLENLRK
ncbi:MAG: DUF2277 domain-containing protein [Candidatus Kariarchaeaceae archaeon]|jgi:hypothetical protein